MELAEQYLELAYSSKEQTLLYDLYSVGDWQARVRLQQAKLYYYKLVEPYKFYGDELDILVLPKNKLKQQRELLALLSTVTFSNNNRGEQAETNFWMAKTVLLTGKKADQKRAAKYLTQCLIAVSPRNRY